MWHKADYRSHVFYWELNPTFCGMACDFDGTNLNLAEASDTLKTIQSLGGGGCFCFLAGLYMKTNKTISTGFLVLYMGILVYFTLQVSVLTKHSCTVEMCHHEARGSGCCSGYYGGFLILELVVGESFRKFWGEVLPLHKHALAAKSLVLGQG